MMYCISNFLFSKNKSVQILGYNSWIVFEWDKPEHWEVMSEISQYTLPIIDKYSIYKVPQESKLVKSLLSSIPLFQSEFTFNLVKSEELRWSVYINYLSFAASKVMNSFSLANLSITENEFCVLLKSSRKCKNVAFNSCSITTENKLDLSGIQKSKISSLSLIWSGK